MLLNCSIQQYAWGKMGMASEVARLKRSSDSSVTVDDENPYAELWMGTHPSGPSKLAASGELLSMHLKGNGRIVGSVPVGYPADDLPFLFKVLSVQSALSIQSHPDKILARELHESFPQHYKDANHKPEMVVAVTPFEAMCGFRSIVDIKDKLSACPEFRILLGDDVYLELLGITDIDSLNEEQQRSLVRRIFCAFMTCAEDKVAEALQLFLTRIVDATDSLLQLCHRLHGEYPGDRGILAPLLLNVIYLQPGQSFYMGPNEPHAYLFGDCVECMALSDNVVRAGLTPKFKHVDVLCSMLHYRCGAPKLIDPICVDEFTQILRPDPTVCVEFELEISRFPRSVTYEFQSLPCASLLLILRGNAVSLSSTSTIIPEGSVLFQSAEESLVFDIAPAAGEQVCIIRAHVNMG